MRDEADFTAWLTRWGAGDANALARLLPRVYDELRGLAAGLLSGTDAPTLQPTALVNEALLKLLGGATPDLESRRHFFGVAARAMRQVLVDHARRRGADKRGGRQVHLELEAAADVPAEAADVDVLALNTALDRLETLDAQQVRIVELRYFAGLSIEAVAATLGLHPSMVYREWTMARAWLRRELAA